MNRRAVGSVRHRVDALKERQSRFVQQRKSHRLNPLFRVLAILGPGIIVANAGNDAGGVFTYSDIGAKYGLDLLWTFIPITISLIVVQEMVARLGCLTGKGLMDLIRERFGVRWTLFVSIIVVIANGGTLLAEFAGAAGALSLFGLGRPAAIIGSAILVTLLVARGNRRFVESVFLAMGLAFVSYFITAFLVPARWKAVGGHLLIPTLAHAGVPITGYLADTIALVGTTITPYMQLYLQSSIVDKAPGRAALPWVRFDVITGALFSNIVAVFIIITTAGTLFFHGDKGIGIDSVPGAAQALAPLVGIHAKQLFAIGLLGASLLAAAVLPLSTAFVVCEAFGSERSVERKPREAPLFFLLFFGITAIAAAIMLIPGISITTVAIGTQTLDGLLLPFLLIFILILANDAHLLGTQRNHLTYNVISVATVVVISVMDLLLLGFSFIPS